MNKIIIGSLFLIVGLMACGPTDQEMDKLEIAKQYYQILNHANDASLATLLADSIVIRENEYDYEEKFSKNGYVEWWKWEAVFEPKYEVFQMEREHEIVKTKISKIDKRIQFLHDEPIVWNEIIHFDKNRIIKVERVNYLTFNGEKFVKKRDELSNWIDKNHPEFSGFLNGQTEAVGKKYLKAIEQYKGKN